jgi:branched-chain amino acid aminotransferase
VNGKISADTHATISILDHGFLYGDSAYEAVRTWKGKPFLVDEHLARLARSAAGLCIDLPSNIPEAIQQVLHADSHGEWEDERLLRIIVTRGKGHLGYDIDPAQKPGLVIISRPVPKYPARFYTEGLRLAVVGVRRQSRTALDPALKTSNLLNLRLAFFEAHRAGADDSILLNADGDVAEASGSNVFIVSHGRVLTPPLDAGILAGITRTFVIDLARDLEVPIAEERISLERLHAADEIFITSTTRSVMPAGMLDGKPIGAHGAPGPVTKRLMEGFEKRVGVPLYSR